MHTKAEGYDPRRSKVSDDTFASFQRDALSGELTDVPGIGPAAAKKLGQIGDGETEFDRVTNTYQLIGKVSFYPTPKVVFLFFSFAFFADPVYFSCCLCIFLFRIVAPIQNKIKY